MRAVVAQPKWPTLRWVVGELKYYVVGAGIAGFSAICIGLILAIAHAAFEKAAPLPSPSTIPAAVPSSVPAPLQLPTPVPTINISAAFDLVAWNQALTENTLDGYRNYILHFPRDPNAHVAMNFIHYLLSKDAQLQSAEMQLADADSSLPLIAELIEHKSSDPGSLEEFASNIGLKYKYPLGYAMFYSDGTKLLSYETSVGGPIQFDPSVSHVTFPKTPNGNGVTVCFDILPIRINGAVWKNFRDICVGGAAPILHAVRLDYVSLDAEYLASSPRGLAWVIGMTP